MRPVRFVALSEDGQAMVLTDEVGRMLSLAIDEQVTAAVSREKPNTQGQLAMDVESTLTPRDIQARIRSGDSAERVARLANVPMEKVLRFAGPVLQERAAMAQLARRTRLRGTDASGTLSDVVDARLRSHGVDVETVAWDAYRREDGGWRVTATWPSGKATAHALWDLDRARSTVTPVEDMAQFLSAERPLLLAQEEHAQGMAPRLTAAGRFAEDAESKEGPPAVPSLAVLRGRPERRREDVRDEPRSDPRPEPSRLDPAARFDPAGQAGRGTPAAVQSPRPRRAELPSWDDILFGARRGQS